ncbi:sialic acid synthase-like [Oncorhynchus nerka]|uniref:sialic acid synthase-like n=1 Tax=Oncorhynchus nerka TaxID=8023 RepID=UPI0031B800E9
MVGGSNPCFIIAEIGQNHQGDIEIAKKMTKMAKDCGTDCAKFQKSELEYKFNKRALERPYTSKHSWGKTYERHTVTTRIIWSSVMNSIESSRNMGVGIFFTASGMDEVALDFLDELDEPFFKVASCDANSFPYLELTAKKLRKSVVSKVVIPKGTVLSMDMLGLKVGEPGGMSPASRNVWWMATTTRAESTRCAFVQQDTTLWNVQIERCYVKQTC